MSNRIKYILVSIGSFIGSYIIAFFIVGYYKNTALKRISWIPGVTAWDKFREYYIRTFSDNLMPAFVLAVILTAVVMFVYYGIKTY